MSSRVGKTFVFGGLAVGAGAMFVPQQQQAKGAVIAGWTFETSLAGAAASTTAATVGPLAAETGTGSATGVHASAVSVYSNPAGNGSLHALSSDHWAGGDYYQFSVSTLGQQDIGISFDQTRSGTGPNSFSLQYSTNGGGSFNTFGTYTLAGTGFSTATAISNTAGVNFSFDLSAINGLENISTALFRVVSDGLNSSGGTVATAGTSRIDNVVISSNVPEPTTMALVTVAAAAALARRRRGE